MYPSEATTEGVRVFYDGDKEDHRGIGRGACVLSRLRTGLEWHPTCGFVAETYRSHLKILIWALPEPFESNRPYASAPYFLVTPDIQIVMPRIRTDQLYHHYLGDPLELLLLYPDGSRGCCHCRRRSWIGRAARAGRDVSRLAPGVRDRLRALLASTEWPGVEPPDVEHGDIDALVETYPGFREEIYAFTSY